MDGAVGPQKGHSLEYLPIGELQNFFALFPLDFKTSPSKESSVDALWFSHISDLKMKNVQWHEISQSCEKNN